MAALLVGNCPKANNISLYFQCINQMWNTISLYTHWRQLGDNQYSCHITKAEKFDNFKTIYQHILLFQITMTTWYTWSDESLLTKRYESPVHHLSQGQVLYTLAAVTNRRTVMHLCITRPFLAPSTSSNLFYNPFILMRYNVDHRKMPWRKLISIKFGPFIIHA